MSLIAWLPLTKDLRNQGINNYSITVMRGSETWNDNGKLGKCFHANGVNTLQINNIIPNLYNINGYSLCAWFYIEAQNTVHSGAGIISGGNWNNQVLNLSVSDWSFDHYTRLRVSGTNWNNTYTYNFYKNTWYHAVVCSDGNKTYAYINGQLIGDTVAGFLPSSIEGNNIAIGGATYYSGMQFFGKINDVRIYDHCLSPMEVKQISQGLVLHYNLNGDNNTKVPCGYQELEYIESSGSSYFNTNYYFNPEIDGCKVIFKGNDTSNNGMIFADSGGRYFWIYYYYSGSCIRLYASNGTGQQSTGYITQDLNIHTVEYKNKHFYIDGVDKNSLTNTYSEDTSTIWLFSYGSNNYPFKGRIYYTDITRNGKVQKTYIPAKRLSDSAVGMYELINDEFFVSAATAFTAGPVVATPSIVYDNSGFCNNGTIYKYDNNGDIVIDSNTPKYSFCTHINAGSPTESSSTGLCYLYSSCALTTPNQLTIAFWCKPIHNYQDSTSRQGVFCTTNDSIGTGAGTDYSITAMHHRDGLIDVCQNDGIHTTINTPFVVGEWHHYAFLYNGKKIQWYKDGNFQSEITFGNTNDLKSFSAVVIGFTKAGGVFRKNDCYMSDFRIYVTALSADDVKSLYQNCATIDPDGTIRGQIRS